MKVFLFEVLIVSLQTMPGFQILAVFGVQALAFMVIIKALLWDKIYQFKVLGYTELLFEFTFVGFLAIGMISQFFGLSSLAESTSENI